MGSYKYLIAVKHGDKIRLSMVLRDLYREKFCAFLVHQAYHISSDFGITKPRDEHHNLGSIDT